MYEYYVFKKTLSEQTGIFSCILLNRKLFFQVNPWKNRNGRQGTTKGSAQTRTTLCKEYLQSLTITTAQINPPIMIISHHFLVQIHELCLKSFSRGCPASRIWPRSSPSLPLLQHLPRLACKTQAVCPCSPWTRHSLAPVKRAGVNYEFFRQKRAVRL